MGLLIRKHGVSFHCYADDTHLYLLLQSDHPKALQPVRDCFREIKDWMSHDCLLANDLKTDGSHWPS